ncbi:hypothetical protein ACVWYN_003568 [Pedobacter sp. UYP24]
MAHMQDKEFDQLFKDQFAEAEITPSANLWGKIEQELGPKKRTILPAYWMAAAVAIIAVTVGLLIPKTEKIQLRGSTDFVASTMAATDNAPKAEIREKTAVKEVSSSEEKSTPLVIAPRLTAEDVKKDFAMLQPIAAESHPVHINAAVANTTLAKVVEPVAPVNETMMANAAVEESTNTVTEVEQPERRGIRNVGDLVNIVVNKVDKREKKLIQFNTDEDDNSSLIAINIGFLKINKREK